MGLSAGPGMKPYVTERDRLARELRFSQRMSSLLLLALGMALGYLGVFLIKGESLAQFADIPLIANPVLLSGLALGLVLLSWKREAVLTKRCEDSRARGLRDAYLAQRFPLS